MAAEQGVSMYMKYGADEKLARYMSLLFSPLKFSPTGTFDERIKQAQVTTDFQSLAFTMLLKGETEQARVYIKKALDYLTSRGTTILDITSGTIHGLEVIYGDIQEVQRVVTASKDDFNRVRIEESGLKNLEDYLV